MKVQGPGRPNVNQVQDKAQVKNTETPNPAKGAGERVEVSSLSKLLAQSRGSETVDTAKVEHLRDSIRAGEFKVDHQQVADTMLREES